MSTAETSTAAAQSIAPHARIMRRQVAEFIANAGAKGATDEEVQIGLGMNPSTQRPRRGEVWAYGLITDSLGEKRATTSGRGAVVWHVTKAGLKALSMAENEWAADNTCGAP